MYRHDHRIVLTLDAGGTNFVFSAIRGCEELIAPVCLAAVTDDTAACLQVMVEGFSRVAEQLDAPPVAISFAFPGPADYEHGIIGDLPNYLQVDSTSVLALWQRTACQSRINQFQASEGTNIELKLANVQADLNHALTLSPQNAYLLYNRGNLNAQRLDYHHAIEDYSQAITLEPNLAEAYFNRGLCLIYQKKTQEGIADLSKAGELGLYAAYSLIKKYRSQK